MGFEINVAPSIEKELDEILEKAMGEIKETVANTTAKAAVDVFAEAKNGGDAGSIARKISEACIECMAVGLKKGFAAAMEFMREK